MKISKKVRDEAILICLCAASDEESGRSYLNVARDLGLPSSGRSYRLAFEAWVAVDAMQYGVNGYREVDAEAAALLADGWCPGDPVEVLR